MEESELNYEEIEALWKEIEALLDVTIKKSAYHPLLAYELAIGELKVKQDKLSRLINEVFNELEHLRLPDQPQTVCGRNIDGVNFRTIDKWDNVPDGKHCPKCYVLHLKPHES